MSIARLHRVEKCRKSPGSCGKCSTVITAGQPYSWWTIGFRSRYKHLRCSTCPSPKESERESNSSLAMIWSTREAFYEAVEGATTGDDLKSAADDAASGVREAIDDWEDKKSNLESGFPNGCPAIEEIEEKISEAESLADALESWEPDEAEEAEEGEDAEIDLDSNRDSCLSAWDDNCNL